MFNLNELVVFLTAAEYGNYSEAGRQLHVSQPAVSQTIDNLQKHLGTKLFVRHGRSVRLTEAGHVLLPMAKELLASAKRLDEIMVSLQGEVIGEMNVGCSTASGTYMLPRLIARFRRLYSKVRINVFVSSRESLLRKLLAGDIAIGVSSKQVERRDIEYQEFNRDDVILVVPANHRWTQYRRIYPDDLLDEPIILREEMAVTREVLMENLREHNILPEALNVAMVLDNPEAIEIAVEEGIGVAFISRLAAERGLEMGRVVEVHVDGMLLSRSIFLARNRRFPMTCAQNEFWTFTISSNKVLLPVV